MGIYRTQKSDVLCFIQEYSPSSQSIVFLRARMSRENLCFNDSESIFSTPPAGHPIRGAGVGFGRVMAWGGVPTYIAAGRRLDRPPMKKASWNQTSSASALVRR